MMNMMTGAVAINGGVGVMEIRQPQMAEEVAQTVEQIAADIAENAHITLHELKGKLDAAVEKKLPSFKALMEICKELGKPESLITHVGDRKGHDMRYAIDPTKIHNELGWLPETKFEDGIKKTIQWYLDNREWWETIISGEYQNYYEKMYSNR